MTHSLPLALSKLGVDARVIIPAYASARKSGYNLTPVTNSFKVKIGQKRITVKLLEARGFHLPVYFIDAPFFFDREGIYGPSPAEGFADNLERYTLFCKAVMQGLPMLNWSPEVIHAHDWQAALIPAYLKQIIDDSSPLRQTGSLLTIHNLVYQGVYPWGAARIVELDEAKFPRKKIGFFGKFNFLKVGITAADRVNTVSPGYREETLEGGETGAGLEDALRSRGEHYSGILNGIDYDAWSPVEDKYLAHRFNGDWSDFKRVNKSALAKECGLAKVTDESPILGMVGRLVDQKGIDILLEAMDDILKNDCSVVMLGSGNEEFVKMMRGMAKDFPARVHFDSTHNEPLAHRIYAGSDMFIMPSRFEPCGLSQMIAMRYGTIPVVRDVGGLKDSVMEFDPNTMQGNGFKFTEYSGEGLLSALNRAFKIYGDKPLWSRLMENAVDSDFTWKRSAGRYLELYREIQSEANS